MSEFRKTLGNLVVVAVAIGLSGAVYAQAVVRVDGDSGSPNPPGPR